MNFISSLSSGPRFVLNLIRIFDGSFGGPTIFENPKYTSPNEVKIYRISKPFQNI